MTNPKYRSWLKEYCDDHGDHMIRASEEMVLYLLEIDRKLPNEYGWRFSSEDALRKQLNEAANNYRERNSIFWEDQARNVEAYSVMTLWRGAELARACLNGVNEKEVIAPAVLGRSLLELSTVFLLNANSLHKTFGELSFPENTLVTSTEVEELVVKMIWGTRYGEPEPHVTQTNIMTSLQRLSRNPKADKLMPTYNFLCDIAHPSFIGNTSYWSHVESVYPDGSEKRILSRSSSRQFNEEILDKTIWALGWSSACIRNAFEIMSEANQILLGKLKAS
ncbi:hypothetical protein [Thioalkalivibrio sp. ALE11]|uniref:hypothetical protein n=1 Tax=Thioalkalivibrio sp. ALE11 TaxID=1265494 RepID=UPI0012DED4B9|nr:hypothetical protein [Thioalkalivibrio sp. ALE11]